MSVSPRKYKQCQQHSDHNAVQLEFTKKKTKLATIKGNSLRPRNF